MAKISINDIILVRHDVGAALVALKDYVKKNGMQEFYNGVESIEADFNLMCDYMLRGFIDPQSDAVYAGLLERTYRLYNNVRTASIVKKRSSFANARRCATAFDSRVEAIRASLENFVQERAIGNLLYSDQKDNSSKDLAYEHQNYMNQLFCHIMTSEQWAEGVSDRMIELLVSPTVEQNDVLLTLSAIMLALTNVFDIEKWLTLFGVYEQAKQVRVRQRALVGWVFGLPLDDVSFIFPIVREKLDSALCDENVRHELLELQMQIFYCSNAETDNEQIRRDIMPTLIKNSDIANSASRFIERDDSMDDILGDASQEDKMEKLEKTMSQMMDMQKAGIDIYYGGFSQMKRFHFFYQLSNWFCPYTPEHPELKSAFKKLGDNNFLDNILENGPFCDSDKYSFALGVASVIDRLPQNVREAIGNKDILGPTMPAAQYDEAAYVRRSYLQDLYRFFKLAQYKDDFSNIFRLGVADDAAPGFIFSNMFFDNGALTKERTELMAFLHKRHLYSYVIKLAEQDTDAAYNVNTLRILASAYYRSADMKRAGRLYDDILATEPCDTFALKGKAKVCFALRDYTHAEAYYKRLVALADNNHNNLCLATSQICCGNIAEGMSILFRLNYENADNAEIMRVLAWGYLMNGKAAEADKIYDRLSSLANMLDSDILNSAYAKWGMRKMNEAVTLFRRYLNRTGKNIDNMQRVLSVNFDEDKALLDANRFSASERNVMLYLVGKNDK